jgi:isoquinoline 1-oxidoreductase beta subunit
VNNIQHSYAQNCFAYEIAEAAGRDPLEVLLEMTGEADVMDLAKDGVKEYWNYGDSRSKTGRSCRYACPMC